MEDKIKLIVENLINAGIDMNAFFKASGLSIKEKIKEVSGGYYTPMKKSRYKRKALRY